MDTTPQQAPETNTPHFAENKKGGIGPIISIVVIIILLALGGFYYFTTGVEQLQNKEMSAEEEAAMTASEEAMLREQGNSTAITDIEADVNATDLSGLDGASADFESELNAQ